MSRPLLLHIGDDPFLRTSRTEILRAGFSVVVSSVDGAWNTFLNGDFDVVLLCSSIPPGVRSELVQRIRGRSPLTVIAEMGEFVRRDDPVTVWVSPFEPETMNDSILAELHNVQGSVGFGPHGRDRSAAG